MPTIPRKLPNSSLEDWNKNKPTPHMAREHLERVIRCAPASWQAAVRERLAPVAPPMLAVHRAKTDREWLQEPPEWAQAWDLLQAIAQMKARGTTFVVMTHRVSVLGVADKMLVLRDGTQQAFGPRDEVLATLQQAKQQPAAPAARGQALAAS